MTIQDRLHSIWAHVLQRDDIDPERSFFSYGVPSLWVIDLANRMQAAFGLRVTPGVIARHPTIPAQVAWLADPDHDVIVPLKPEGHGRPLFLIHAGAGHTLYYRGLVEYLPGPVFGLENPPLAAYHSLSDLADLYVEAIRRVQPQGPYQLGGFSFGGVLAYEMAHQLGAAQVEALILIDARHRHFREMYKRPVLRTYELLERIDYHLRTMRKAGPVVYLRDVLRMREARQSLDQTYFFHYRLIQGYYPQPFAGPATLIKAGWQPVIPPDATLGWGAFIPRLTVHTIGGFHAALLSQPRVQTVATYITPLLADGP